MIKCKPLNKTFETKEMMFSELRANKDILISAKKSDIKQKAFELNIFDKSSSEKNNITSDDFEIGKNIYCVLNSCMVMDSHDDVSLMNSWKKTAVEQNGKIMHTSDHTISADKIVAYPQDVNLHVVKSKFNTIGLNSYLDTELLVFESKITNLTNKNILNAYKSGIPLEHSVRLRYIDVKLAMNSDHEDDKEEKVIYDKHIDSILNKEDVDSQGFFFAVYEQALTQEGSTVINGSNSKTPILSKNTFDNLLKSQPLNNTGKSNVQKTIVEPSIDTLSIDKIEKYLNSKN